MDALAAVMRSSSPAPGGASLVARLREGSEEAFEELVTLFERRLLRTAWHLLGNAEDARDAAQEVFLRAYGARRRLDPDRDPAGFLYRITVNVCRTLRRRARPAEPLAEMDEPGQEAGQVQVLEAHDARRTVVRALACLTRKERAAVVLRDLEELDTEEVAAVLGCSVSTVRSHLSRARVKLANHLLPRGEGA